jgi:hypothetical protein
MAKAKPPDNSKARARLRGVVEGAVTDTTVAKRAAAAERIRATITEEPPPVAPEPAPEKPKQTRKPKPEQQTTKQTTIEKDVKLESSSESNVPPASDFKPMPADEAQKLRDVMLSSRPRRKPPEKSPEPAPEPPKPASESYFKPVGGPAKVLGRMLYSAGRQGKNIAANAVAIPAAAAAATTGAYAGLATTAAAVRGISRLLGQAQPAQEPKQESPPAPLPPPAQDYRSGLQRAIEDRKKPPPDIRSDINRKLQQIRGMV